MPYVERKGPGQRVYLCSLIKAFIAHLENQQIHWNMSLNRGHDQLAWMGKLILACAVFLLSLNIFYL